MAEHHSAQSRVPVLRHPKEQWLGWAGQREAKKWRQERISRILWWCSARLQFPQLSPGSRLASALPSCSVEVQWALSGVAVPWEQSVYIMWVRATNLIKFPKGNCPFWGFQQSVGKIFFPFVFPSYVPHNLSSILKSTAQTAEKRGEAFLRVPLPPEQSRHYTCFFGGLRGMDGDLPFSFPCWARLGHAGKKMKLTFGIGGGRWE